MASVYCAARYARRTEVQGYADQVLALGYDVTARWLKDREGLSSCDTGRNIFAPEVNARLAQADLDDLRSADIVLAFTEDPASSYGRGGRHIEAGAALAWGILLVIIGPPENIFYDLPQVRQFTTWESCYAWLQTRKRYP